MRMRKVKKALEKFPAAKMHWALGHLSDFPTDFGKKTIAHYLKCSKERPRMDVFWAGNWITGYIRVWHPDTVKTILKTSEPKYITYGTYKYGVDWFGKGLVLHSGERWARNRKLLTPAFHFGALKQYIKIKNQCSQTLLDKLLKNSERKTEETKSVEMFVNFSKLTADILLRSAFSYECDIQNEGHDEPYINSVSILAKLWLLRTINPFLLFDFVYKLTSNGRTWSRTIKVVHEFTDRVIAEKKKNIGRLEKKDFLEILLSARDEDGDGLSDEEIRNEVDVFMFAGHDTTTSALSWTAYSLAANPQEQEKCQEEIDGLLEGRDSDEITSEDLHSLPYLSMCIKESMRLNNVVPMIEREISKPFTIENVEVPKHTMVTIILMCLHLNEEIWPEPMKYKPERFLPENIKNMDPYSFVPFSAGPRNCIGQHFALNEIKIVLARLLRRVTFRPDPDNLPRQLLSIVMKSENGMHLYVEERNKTSEH